jgi:hypothetical protein
VRDSPGNYNQRKHRVRHNLDGACGPRLEARRIRVRAEGSYSSGSHGGRGAGRSIV